jgi:hypothetical protein
MAFFYVSGLLLIAEYGDNPLGCRYLHAQELLPYDYVKFVHETSAENREVWVINVDHIKGESLCYGVVEISEGYMKRYLYLVFLRNLAMGISIGGNMCWLRFIFSKVFKNKMSVELPLSTRTFPMIHPAMFTSMTMASL